MNSITYSLWQILTDFLIPESLANQSAINHTLLSIQSNSNNNNKFHEELSLLKNSLLPGDILIVRTPGSIYKIFRLFTGHNFDHLAIIMDKSSFLHVGPPYIRLLPIELLLQPNRKTIVLRPKLTENQLSQLLIKLQSLLGQKYDSIKVYSFIIKLAIQKFITGKNKNFIMKHKVIKDSLILSNTLNKNIMTNNNNQNHDIHSFICTDAILSRILSVSDEFRLAVNELSYLDYSLLNSWSINDVYNLAILKPNLLKQINLPKIDLKLFNQIKYKNRKTKNINNNIVNNVKNNNTNNTNRTKILTDCLEAFQSLFLGFIQQIPMNLNEINLSPRSQSKFHQLLQFYSTFQQILPNQFRSSFYATLCYIFIKYCWKHKFPTKQKLILRSDKLTKNKTITSRL